MFACLSILSLSYSCFVGPCLKGELQSCRWGLRPRSRTKGKQFFEHLRTVLTIWVFTMFRCFTKNHRLGFAGSTRMGYRRVFGVGWVTQPAGGFCIELKAVGSSTWRHFGSGTCAPGGDRRMLANKSRQKNESACRSCYPIFPRGVKWHIVMYIDPGWFFHYRKGSVGFRTNLKKAWKL